MNEIDQIKALRRAIAIKESRDNMLSFVRFMMPDPEDVDDAAKSQFEITPQAQLLCQVIEKMDKGELDRVAVSIGPQFGKSLVLSRAGPAWLSGRDPRRNIMVGAYNDDFANEFGGDVRAIMSNRNFELVFPDHALIKGGTAKDNLITVAGGKLAFVGVGGSGTGKPADFFFVDDPIRNDQDAQSAAYRERVWKWFTGVTFSRLLSKSRVLVVHTRWSTDDLIGRLCDPEHPERNKLYKGIADRWTYINIPAVVEDEKLAKALGLTLEPQKDPNVVSMFGAKPIAALSPTRKSLQLLAEAKQLDPRIFSALYMGKPTPDDGEYFTTDMLVEYEAVELPTALRKYAASDHAVGMKDQANYTVLGCAGVDEKDDIWILPDLVWDRMKTDKMVDEMVAIMKRHDPMMWWMEDEMISKSFGPFLRKRMEEEKVYTYIDGVSVHKTDKQLRARAIQGRMQMRKVRFPRFARWWPAARSQLLKFPFGAQDDFVDFLAHLGHGLTKEIKASAESRDSGKESKTGSIDWILKQSLRRARFEKRIAGIKGW